uniref:Uncharacterized protein n=1 Tax=Nelumbo nucifera TaxID=4432 RepID=A0A822Y530_NELNU|nr:TPA_asm: hypothetical protein HUJ06_028591 [Nelumbo nucifera]
MVEIEDTASPPRSYNRDGRSNVRDIKSVRINHCNSEDIDECAEAFIKRFREHLQIQRLDSIENY